MCYGMTTGNDAKDIDVFSSFKITRSCVLSLCAILLDGIAPNGVRTVTRKQSENGTEFRRGFDATGSQPAPGHHETTTARCSALSTCRLTE